MAIDGFDGSARRSACRRWPTASSTRGASARRARLGAATPAARRLACLAPDRRRAALGRPRVRSRAAIDAFCAALRDAPGGRAGRAGARAPLPRRRRRPARRQRGAARRAGWRPRRVAAGFVAGRRHLRGRSARRLRRGAGRRARRAAAPRRPRADRRRGRAGRCRRAAPPVAVVADSKLIRDAQLDRYLAAHKQFAGTSALGVPSAFLRSATVDSDGALTRVGPCSCAPLAPSDPRLGRRCAHAAPACGQVAAPQRVGGAGERGARLAAAHPRRREPAQLPGHVRRQRRRQRGQRAHRRTSAKGRTSTSASSRSTAGSARSIRHNDVVHTVWPASHVAMIEQREHAELVPGAAAGRRRRHRRLVRRSRRGQRAGRRPRGQRARDPRRATAYRYGYRLWADRASGLLLRAEVVGERGDVLETSAFSDVVDRRPAAARERAAAR